jgi:hypothetical protein
MFKLFTRSRGHKSTTVFHRSARICPRALLYSPLIWSGISKLQSAPVSGPHTRVASHCPIKIRSGSVRILLFLVHVELPSYWLSVHNWTDLPQIHPTRVRSEIEAPLITREVLPEIYFLSVITSMAADAQARQFLQFQASC